MANGRPQKRGRSRDNASESCGIEARRLILPERYGTPTPVQKSQCTVALWAPHAPVVMSMYWD